MARAAVRRKTGTGNCADCGARIILALGVPPLDRERGPSMHVARHEATGGWTGRVLETGEDPRPGEYRHPVHQCQPDAA